MNNYCTNAAHLNKGKIAGRFWPQLFVIHYYLLIKNRWVCFMDKKIKWTAIWMVLSVLIIYFLLDMFVLEPLIEWIKGYFSW